MKFMAISSGKKNGQGRLLFTLIDTRGGTGPWRAD